MTQAMRQLPGITIVPFHFIQDAVAASQSAVVLAPVELADPSSGNATTSLTGYPMPAAGEILYTTVHTSVAGTDGLATASATINGTADADTAVSLADAAVVNSTTVVRGKAQFAAGDIIGGKLTTDGDWDGTTADLVFTVYAALWL